MIYQTWADAGIMLPPGATGEVDVRCPECSDKRTTAAGRAKKCLSLNVEKGTWECKHCGWTGGISKPDWRQRAGVPRKFTRPEPVEDPQLPKWVLAYFANRGIERDVLERNGVYADTWDDRRAIAMPMTRDGEIIAVKYRLEPKDFRITKGAEQIPFGLDTVKGADTVYVVEGEVDLLTVEQVTGCRAVLSPPSGATPKPEVVTMMAEAVESANKIVLAGDMDEPGREFMQKLADRFGLDRCWLVSWPEKDANDTLVKHGADAVRECLSAARPYPVKGIVTISDIRDRALDLYDRGLPPGKSTGCAELDVYYSLSDSEFDIYTGVPNSGKTRFLDWLMANRMQAGDIVGMCSMETRPLERQVARFASLVLGKPFRDGPTARMTRGELGDVLNWMEGRFFLMSPDNPTLDSVTELIETLIRRHGVNQVVVDPYNRMDHSRPSHMSETEFAHLALAKMQRVMQNHDIHGCLVAHPKKVWLKEDGQYPVITPYDIAGSAAFFNIPDNIVSVWRDAIDDTAPVQIHIQKVRNEENGKRGMCPMKYDVVTGRYTPVGGPVRAVPTYSRQPFPDDPDEQEYAA